MSESRIAARYAKSLYDRALEAKSLQAVASEVNQTHSLLKESRELSQFLDSPLISKDHKRAALHKIFASFSAEFKGLVDLLISKNRENLLAFVVREFIIRFNQLNGITEALVTTAIPLDDETQNKVISYVKNHTGAREVQLSSKIDPAIIGGFTIMFEGKIYDSSILSQIKRIKQELKIA